MNFIKLKIFFLKENNKNVPPKFLIKNWINESIKLKNIFFNINILITSKNIIKFLNKKYKNKNIYTNVLTFKSPIINIKNNFNIYCDILICKKIIEIESINYKKELNSHWAHIIIHSCLHLINYNHKNYDEYKNMKNKEVEILSKFNFKDPHL